MIEETLQFIRTQLSNDPTLDLNANDIIAENLHTLHNDPNKEGLFLSLVNIEEEATMKNKPNYVRINSQLRRMEPPVVLNLYILFAFKLSTYTKSITKLAELISFFQTNKWFTLGNMTDTQDLDPPIDKLIFEMYNVNFEQLNHIWSVLGGNHYPSVLYKIRVVKVQRNEHLEAPEVTTISLDSQLNL
ncbi:MAG: DUF4255 domain-containing protein [Flavobacteriaceae bacterium]